MEEKIKSKEEIQESVEVQPEGTMNQLEAADEKEIGIEDKAESINEKVEVTEIKAESVNEKAESTEIKAESVNEKAESTEIKTESVNEKAERTESKIESADERAEDTGGQIESGDKEAESTGEKPGNAEEGSECVKNTVAEGGTEAKSADIKSRRKRKKIAGFMELAIAFLLTALSAWLFLNTRGTRLLYVSVATGRVSRYYWIFLLAAVVIGVIGLVTLKSSRRAKVQK